MIRSTKPETRNPLLLLPASEKLRQLPPDARAALGELLAEISQDARTRAEQSWRKHKGPMAAYWKAVAVYSRHARIALRSAS